MSGGNKGVIYIKPGEVDVVTTDYPKLELTDGPGVAPDNVGRVCRHGVILKVLATNICGSDQHMVRGRTTAPEGLVLGHEITGEMIERGRDVEFIKVGDLVSVPFNIACGRCRNCKEGRTGICLNVNPARPGGAYGYVDMGGWVGGQAEYVMVPYADFNLLRFPDRDAATAKIRDLTMLSDILPTGYHGARDRGRRRSVPRCTSQGRARSASRPPPRPSCSARPSSSSATSTPTARAGPQLRLRDRRPAHRGRSTIRSRRSSAYPKWMRRSTRWASKRGPRPGRPRSPGDRAQLADGRDAGQVARSASPGCTSRTTRAASTRTPRSAAQGAARPRLGEGHHVHHRADAR